MIKRKLELLEDIYNQTSAIITDSEVQIEYLKKQDPKEIVLRRNENVAGQIMPREYTASMIITQQEGKIAENKEVLNVIRELIGIETQSRKPITSKQGDSVSPGGSSQI